MGRLDEASAAFQRLRSVDDDPSHEVYAFHGLIEVELRREDWRRALDLAVDATRVDRAGRTTDILAYRGRAGLRPGRAGGARARAGRVRARRAPATSTAGCTWRPGDALRRPPSRSPAADVQWTRCPSCDAFVYYKRLQRNLGVCPECNYHFRIPVATRLEQLLDEGSFEDLSGDLEPLDALGFADSKPYAQRIEEAQRKTGYREGLTYGTATVGGKPLVIAVMNFAFVGGSMGSAVGEGVTRAAELALEQRTPLLVVCTSGGARMQEGCLSLMQMAKTSPAFARLHEEGVLVVCLLTDPTYGGVSASFATLGDVLLAEPHSLHRLRRPEGDRADDPPGAARGLPDRRVPARPRDARPGRAAREHPGRAAQAARAAHAPGGRAA